MQSLRSAIDHIRETYTPVSSTSTFRDSGQITPEEYLLAGDFLVYKFPSWAWSDASSPKQRVAYLPAGKQFLVTRNVPCRRRLDEHFAGGAGLDADLVVGDGFEDTSDADAGWLRTGGENEERSAKRQEVGDVRLVDDKGEMGERVADEDEIPDMDDDDDEQAVIRDPKAAGQSPLRTYTLYIAYSPYYRTPRLYLSGYSSPIGSPSVPLAPTAMMEDVVGDYKDKTVTLEDFSFLNPPIKTVSVHPCRHASVMKVLLDRADAALKIRTAKARTAGGSAAGGAAGVGVSGNGNAKESGSGEAEWEVLGADDKSENAIRVDQYLVVFLKFMASVTPGIEHDYTMGV